jgi:hypothetical protein
MKFKITRSSDWNYKEEKEINTLEELIEFNKEKGNLILKEDEIEIYDDYRE